MLEDNIPVSKLAAAELRLVAEHDTYHNGYNGTPGGETPPMSVPEVVAKSKATKNTAASRAKTVAAGRRHWDNPVAHADHADSLRASLRKSATVRAAALHQLTIKKRETKMATMTEQEKALYVCRLENQNARNKMTQQKLKLLQSIPGYEKCSRKDVCKAIKEGVLERC